MKKIILNIGKWIFNNLVGIGFIVGGLYNIVFRNEMMSLGIMLLFWGIFIIQSTKIVQLENRISELEKKL